MCALIAMAVFDTDANKRTSYTIATLECLSKNVNWNRHRLIVIDNNSCKATKDFLRCCDLIPNMMIISCSENIGTAKAINLGWKERRPQEHLVKMDNDCDIPYLNFFDEMEEVLDKGDRVEPNVGIIALKRFDLWENPHRQDDWQSQLIQLPQQAGERWWNIEVVKHAIGTCQMYHYKLIETIGGMCQMEGIYGYDDSLAAIRAYKAGYLSAFLSHIPIHHLDDGSNPYQKEKEAYAGTMMAEYSRYKDEYLSGERDIYVEI